MLYYPITIGFCQQKCQKTAIFASFIRKSIKKYCQKRFIVAPESKMILEVGRKKVITMTNQPILQKSKHIVNTLNMRIKMPKNNKAGQKPHHKQAKTAESTVGKPYGGC